MDTVFAKHNVSSQRIAMATGALQINCDKHGKSQVAVLCRHLLEGDDEPLGFVQTSAVPGDWQAWCDACEILFNIEEGLTEAFKKFHDMALVCESCFEEIKARHMVE